MKVLASSQYHVHDGMQKLYCNTEDLIQHYINSGFDIIKEMKSKPESFLWVRAKAIVADIPNENGDYFPLEELKKEREFPTSKGTERIPAYKTFEGCRIFSNHDNEDVEKAKGLIVHAELDEENKCVWCTFYIDSEAYPDIDRGIRYGYITDVSMGVQVEWSECSICGNKATKEAEWCEHIKKYKGKRFSGYISEGPRKGQYAKDELVYEINHDLKFIELSLVSDGAFRECEIENIMVPSDIINNIKNFKQKVANVKHDVANKITDCNAALLLSIIDKAENISDSIDQIYKKSSVHQNVMVRKAAVSLLDLLNDVLNKIEAAIVALLTRKDRVDLSHVEKLAKVIADVQEEVSSLLDDGLASMALDTSNVPLQQSPIPAPVTSSEAPAAQPTGGNVAQPQAAPQQPVPQADYTQIGNVGQVMLPMETAPAGGVPLNQENIFDAGIADLPMAVSFAGLQGNVRLKKVAENIGNAIRQIDEILNIKNNSQINQNKINQRGGKDMSLLELLANKILSNNAQYSDLDYCQRTADGKFKVVVSSRDGKVRGYFNDAEVEWEPNITNEDIEQIREGNISKVCEKWLREFSAHCKSGNIRYANVDGGESCPTCSTMEEKLEENQEVLTQRKGSPEDTIETIMEEHRKGVDNRVMEQKFKPHHSVSHGAMECQLEESRMGSPEDTMEQQLEQRRPGAENEVMEQKLQPLRKVSSVIKMADRVTTAMLQALAKTIVEAESYPSEVINVLEKIMKEKDINQEVNNYLTEHSKNKRIARRERAMFGLEKSTVPVNVSLLENIADVVLKNVHEIGPVYKTVLAKIIDNKETVKKIIGKLAAQLNNNGDFSDVDTTEELADKQQMTFEEAVDKVLDAMSTSLSTDDGEVELSVSDIINALDIIDNVLAKEPDKTFDDIIDEINNWDIKEVIIHVENIISIGEKEARDQIFLEIANAVESGKFTESDNAVIALKKLAENKDAAKVIYEEKFEKDQEGVTGEEKLSKQASVEIESGEQRVKYITITCDISDLQEFISQNGISEDEDIVEIIKDFAYQQLIRNGYQVSRDALDNSRIAVNENDGIVKIEIENMFMRTGFDKDLVKNIITPKAVESIARTKNRMMRKAQMPPMFTPPAPAATNLGGAMPMGQGMPGTMPMGQMEQPGMGGGEMPAPEQVDDIGALGLDTMKEEGKEDTPELEKKTVFPIGSICPNCGSHDVDLAESKGECRNCGTKFDIKISLDNIVIPSSDREQEEKSPLEVGISGTLNTEEPSGGASEQVAPQPASPQQLRLPAMASALSWYSPAERFVRLATAKKLSLSDEPSRPVARCIVCGNNDIEMINSKYFCFACGTIGLFNVRRSKKYPDRVINTLKVIFPAK